MNKVWIAVIGVLVIGLGVYGYTSNKKEMAMMEQKAVEQKAMEEKTMMEQKAMMEKEKEGDQAMMEKKDGAMKAHA